MKILTLSMGLLLSVYGYGQNILFKQKNKILEYNYGVTDSVGMSMMTALEKVKYELNFVEKTYQKIIFNDYNIETEIKIDSNDYDQPWMNLPNKFKYTQTGVSIFDKNGKLIRIIPLSSEQQDELKDIKNTVALSGYHPGITNFPSYDASIKSQFQQEGYNYELSSNGDFKLSKGNSQTTFSESRLTITEEYEDPEGKKNKISRVYEKMANNRGLLLKIEKHERFVNLEKGPCLTEVKLKYFNQYVFEDVGNLITKSLQPDDQITLYPNPNNGVFNVAVKLKSGVSITAARAINTLTGQITNIELTNQSILEVNRPDLSKGNYTFQITTSENKIINTNFLKN